MAFINNIKNIAPNLSDIKTGTPLIKIGSNYIVGGIGGNSIPCGQGGSSIDTNFYKCASVDTTNHTWTGYKLIPNADNGYSFADTASFVGEYYIMPTVGKIYDPTGKMELKSYYGGDSYDPYGDGLLYSIFINGGTGVSAPSYGAITTDNYTSNVETVNGITARKFNGNERVTATAPITRSVWSYSVWAKRTDAGYIVGCNNTGTLGLALDSNDKVAIRWLTGYQINALAIQNKFNHFVMTFNSGSYHLYCNGASLYSGTMIPNDVNTMGAHRAFVFGALGASDADYLSGYIANFRFYDHVLTLSEIEALYEELTPSNS